jgi:cellobiose-specific phosphotransferase system component IIC
VQADLAQKYWDVANAIVAFSVLQMVAFLYSLANTSFTVQIVKAFGAVIGAIVFSAILYMAGVVACYRAEMTLRDVIGSDVKRILKHTMWARLGIIGLYSVCGIAVLLIANCHRPGIEGLR